MDEQISAAELEAAADTLTGGRAPADLTSDDLRRLITIGQYVTDLCMVEIEARGELAWHEGVPVIPYWSDHVLDTVLTRG